MGFYGFPERGRRELSWNLLRQLIDNNDGRPWVIISDFNDLLNLEDKIGRLITHNGFFGVLGMLLMIVVFLI